LFSSLGSHGLRRLLIVALVCAALLPLAFNGQPSAQAAGSISLTALDTAYTQDFDTLATSGTSDITPNGWWLLETGANANTTYGADNGGNNSGNTYSYGTGTDTERAFGGLLSGSLTPTIGAQFTNNTGSTITDLAISYRGEMWRLGTSGRDDRLDFQYSTNATALNNGTWTDVDALDFTTPDNTGTAGARNGNAAGFFTNISHTITGLNIPNGATFWIRWQDFNASGSDDGLAVDNFSLTPSSNVVDNPPNVSSTTPADGATNVALNTTITINFNEEVTFSASSFTLSCNSTPQPFTVSSSPATSAVITPNANLPVGANCTVVALAAGIVDTDGTPDNMAADYSFSFSTAAANACGNPFTPIYTIQGSGMTSPLAGNTVNTEGVVTGLFNGSGQFSGFFIQDPVGDSDPTTSDGVFVFDNGNLLPSGTAVGDKVRVSGTVVEFTSTGIQETQISTLTQVLNCGAATAILPTQVNLPFVSATYLERYEGMLITLPQNLYVTEVFTLARFGEVWLSSGSRLLQPTQITTPGAAAVAQQAANDLNRILLDDGSNVQNPDPVIYPAPALSAANTLRVGYTTQNVTGVLGQRFGQYRIQPTATVNFSTAANPRTATPPAINTNGTPNVVVASFNVLNYFNGDGLGGGFPTARGATNLTEFNRQRAKTIAAITALGADVVGLMEMENDGMGANSSLQDLINGLNTAEGAGTWAAITEPSSPLGTDEIRVSIIYKPAKVTPVGAALTDLNSVFSRPPLAQTFQTANGGKFSVVVNHFKSKGCGGATGLNLDQGDGQSCFNQLRTQQANQLLAFISTVQTAAGDDDMLIIGDLNSYAQEDPIAVLLTAGYTDQIAAFVGLNNAHSFVFQGQSGYLDYALTNSTLSPQVTGVAEWDINGSEPIALDYNLEFKSAGQQISFYAPDAYRSSDHDPVIIGLNISAPPVAAPDTIGVFRPTDANFYLRNSNTTGFADIQFLFGTGTDLAVAGDWNGDGISTVGIYRPSTGEFFLKDANTFGAPVVYNFTLGNPGDVPFVGDWDGDGKDGVGVYRPSTGQLFLKNALSTGFADFALLFGDPNDLPVGGDWDGDGFDSPGVYRPSEGRYFLTNQVCDACVPTANYDFYFGDPGDVPFAGDWNANGTDGVGVYRPSNGITYITSTLATGFADTDFIFGIANDAPIAGVWQLPAPDQPNAPEVAPTFVPRQ
jgi:predicted extracellular nuclease